MSGGDAENGDRQEGKGESELSGGDAENGDRQERKGESELSGGDAENGDRQERKGESELSGGDTENGDRQEGKGESELKDMEVGKRAEKRIRKPDDLKSIRIGNSRVFLLGTIKGLKSEEEKVKEAFLYSRPRVIGLHISSEEMKGLKAVIKGKIKKTGLSHGEEIYASNLAVFGEVQIPPPSLVIAYRMARSRNVPLAPLDMNEEEYTRNFTEKVSTFHLVSQSFRLKRLRKRSFNCTDAESFALAWDSAINRSKGYRDLETERERRMAENIYYLAKEHARVLAVLEIERLPGIMKGISDMIEQ